MNAAAAVHRSKRARLTPIPPVDPQLLAAPLDFLVAEHYRQRVVLDHLEALLDGVDAPAAHTIVEGVLRYLHEDLPLHIADEERDLFPLLRRRAAPGDDVEFILALLASEHTRDDALAAAVVDALEVQRGGDAGRPGPKLKSAGPAFAETQRRHLAWENAMVVPWARRLLRPPDLARLGRAMAKRRGLRVPGTRLGERLVKLIRRAS